MQSTIDPHIATGPILAGLHYGQKVCCSRTIPRRRRTDILLQIRQREENERRGCKQESGVFLGKFKEEVAEAGFRYCE
jgi:hypothetical protein